MTLPGPLAALRPKKKNNKEKRVVGSLKSVHSSFSFLVVQNEMLLSEMNDRINEMVIYEEPTDPDNSIDLYEYRCRTPLQPDSKIDAFVGSEKTSTQVPKYKFQIEKTYMEDFTTRTVNFFTRFNIQSVHLTNSFHLSK